MKNCIQPDCYLEYIILIQPVGKMSWLASEKESITFCDVAAYFSEEDWKLLHEWQKQLCTNVMNEIHQALISLGPLIANSVASLRTKQKESESHLDLEDTERRQNKNLYPGYVVPESVVSFGIKEDRRTCSVDSQDTLRNVNNNSLVASNTNNTPDELDISGQGIQHLSHHQDSGRRERKDCLKSDEREDTPFSVDAQFNIKEEQEVYSLKNQPDQRAKNINSTIGDGNLKGQSQNIDSLKSIEVTQTCSSSSRQSDGKVLQSPDVITNFRSQLWAQYNQGLEDNQTTWSESSLSNPPHLNLQQAPIKKGILYKDDNCESKLSNTEITTCLLNAQRNEELYTYVNYDKGFSHNGQFTRPKRLHTEVGLQERPYTCPGCDKRFSLKCDLNRHSRTHTGEKPYACTDCHKSFSLKGDLNRHQRIHTGEKPYTCTDCQKSFSRKYILSVHKRTHIEKGTCQSDMSGGFY
ncbi:zinc finger protein 713-like isoform X1 [Pleurodeles waltl]|uniref:zinc finger protein 713-like isoform X1 n=1 Tax=Pleurodeles waltl TaxID=8319 RepID=UPI00370963B0